MTMRSLFAASSVLLGGLLAVATSNATVITFETAAGATVPGPLPVSAQATFTTSANELQITLTNLLANPKAAGQLLSDLDFAIAGFSGGTLTSSSGQTVTVDGSGVPTLGSTGSTGWILENGFLLCDICMSGKGANAPAYTIIGPPDGSGIYSNANNSIAGNGPHNPFINQSATFTISIPGLTSLDTISSAIFSFGTTFGAADVPGIPVTEPGTLALFGLGLAAIGLVTRRPRRR